MRWLQYDVILVRYEFVCYWLKAKLNESYDDDIVYLESNFLFSICRELVAIIVDLEDIKYLKVKGHSRSDDKN